MHCNFGCTLGVSISYVNAKNEIISTLNFKSTFYESSFFLRRLYHLCTKAKLLMSAIQIYNSLLSKKHNQVNFFESNFNTL